MCLTLSLFSVNSVVKLRPTILPWLSGNGQEMRTTEDSEYTELTFTSSGLSDDPFVFNIRGEEEEMGSWFHGER